MFATVASVERRRVYREAIMHKVPTRPRLIVGVVLLAVAAPFLSAETAGNRASQSPAPDATKPQVLTLASGTTARYRVREQLAGISFPSDAVGTTTAVTGGVIVNPDGSFAPSKISVDLRTLATDQSMRDGFVRDNVLETSKYPTLEVIPKRAIGMPTPLPSGMQAQAGFQLVTDMTVHGVTKEVTWNVVATFGDDAISGRATTTTDFATFNMTKPSLARLLSVDDKINLEIEFRTRRAAS
jgi:polyisoprenoid-binding protein YceI